MQEYRITIIGSGAVGKGAIAVRFVQGRFVEKYDPTIDESYKREVTVDGIPRMLDVMDTAGEVCKMEEYSALRDQFMKTGQGFMIVYNIASKQSFEHTTKLRQLILSIKDDTKIPMILVGHNTQEEGQERQVSKQQGKELAEIFDIPFLEVSAKMNHNITEAFEILVRQIDKWRTAHPEKPKSTKDSGCVLM